jgi:hypothetical protein
MNFRSVLALEFPYWQFESLPNKIQVMILRQVRIGQHKRRAFEEPRRGWVQIPGWEDEHHQVRL